MADTVTVRHIGTGPVRYATRLTGRSDATGETEAVKIDISAFTTSEGQTATYTAIDRIEYSVAGHAYVLLAWDHTADDTIAVLSGAGVIDLEIDGSLVDPQSAGGTGDVVLTTVGAAANASYDITVFWRPKA